MTLPPPDPDPGAGTPEPQDRTPAAARQSVARAPAQPLAMPGPVVAACVLLCVVGGLLTLGGVISLATADQDIREFWDATINAREFMVRSGAVLLAAGLAALVVAVLFRRGRTGVRVSAVILGVIHTVMGLGALPGSSGQRLLLLAAGVLVIVLLTSPQAGAWFGRPRRLARRGTTAA